MSITEDEVRRVATLARLKLSEDETRSLTKDLDRILAYVDKLSELDTSSVEPTSHVVTTTGDPDSGTGPHTAVRQDALAPRNGQAAADSAVANAPRRDGHFFAVPPIIE